MGREIGQAGSETARLIWPFNIAEYETICPKGHSVQLHTGYCVFSPNEWEQWGTCLTCQRLVKRTVGIVDRKFVAGPTHWAEEVFEKERVWLHDVLHGHKCNRCQQLGQLELAQRLLQEICNGAGIDEVIGSLKAILSLHPAKTSD